MQSNKLAQLFGVVVLWVFCLGVQAAATPDPKQAVQEATDILLKKLIEVKPLYTEDPKQFYQEIDQALSPFVDFDGFSRGVMAKYYRRASDEQRTAGAEASRVRAPCEGSAGITQGDHESLIS